MPSPSLGPAPVTQRRGEGAPQPDQRRGQLGVSGVHLALLGGCPGALGLVDKVRGVHLVGAALYIMRNETELGLATLDAARPVLEARGSPARKYSFYVHLAMGRFYVHLAMGRVGQTILLGQSLLGSP